MNKSTGVAFLVVCMFSFIPGLICATPTHPNEVGLYLNTDGTGATGTYEIGTFVDVYLVLTKPSNEYDDFSPIDTIGLFQLALRFSPVPNNDLFIMNDILPPSSLDIGIRKDINQGFWDYDVGISYGNPLMVTNDSAVLVTITFMNMTTNRTEVFLEPVANAYVPGEMVFTSTFAGYQTLHSIGGAHDAPVFVFNGEAVNVENGSFGSLKALYR